jgi:PAS domain S-box-containing protein
VKWNCHREAGRIEEICQIADEYEYMSNVQIAMEATTRIVRTALRSTSEKTLLEEACAIVVDMGYRFCWIGEAEQDEQKTVRPLAWAGHEDGYLSAIKTSWSDSERGRNPAGAAIRTAQPAVVPGTIPGANPNTKKPPVYSTWLNAPGKKGNRSCCALPLMAGAAPFGALCIYSARAGAFGKQEMSLLVNLAEVLSFGAMNLRGRQANEALRESEEAFRVVTDAASEVLWISNIETGAITFVSPAYEKVWRRSTASLYENPKSYIESVHEDDREQVLADLERQYLGLPFDHEYRIVWPDGTIRWVWDCGFSVQDDTGKVIRYAGVAQDITERKQANDVRHEIEKRLKKAQRIAHVGDWFWDLDTGKDTWSDELYRIFDVDPNLPAPRYKENRSLYTAKSWELLDRSVRHAHATGELFSLELEIIRKDGGHRWILVRSEAARDESGRVVRLYGTAQDVTERVLAERELRQNQQRLVEAQRLGRIGSWESDIVSGAVTWSDEMYRICEFTPENFDGSFEEFLKIVHPDDREKVRRVYPESIERGIPYDISYRMRMRDGRIKWVKAYARTEYDIHGTPLRVVGITQDITELKRVEEELRMSEARHRSLFENAVFGIFVSALGGPFLDVNPALVAMLGYSSKEELMAVDPTTQIYRNPEDRGRIIAEFRPLHISQDEVEWIRKDGTIITVRLSGRDVENKEGGIRQTEIIVENVTEARKLEQQLRQAQKMEAVGRLAGGVAHDFNNLLQAIMGYTELLEGMVDFNHPAADTISRILQAAERGSSLTKRMLAFSRRQMIVPQIVDLNKIISGSSDLLKRLVGEDVTISLKPGEELWMVKVDPGQIDQILMNLVANARDAMPAGGRIMIETVNVEADAHFVAQNPEMIPGDYVMLSFADTGRGIASENLPLIFEPFFTTKEIGKGTGLGLAMVYGITKQNNGYISVYSEPDKGTAFRIYFPKTEHSETVPVRKAHAEIPRGLETILVVEDESQVRSLIAAQLELGGYKVLNAESGHAALSLAESNPGKIDLLLTDIIMPGMSGVELCNQMLKIRPETRQMCMSGYTGDHLSSYGQFESQRPLLQKPFTGPILLKKVREVLDA